MAADVPQGEFFRGVAPVAPRRPSAPASAPGAGPGTPAPAGPPSPTLTDVPSRSRDRIRAERGLVVRRRWRRLRAGAGWTWAGLSVVLIAWGIWAVSVRAGQLAGPVISLLLVLAVAGLVFVVAQLLGRAVLEQTLHRQRTTAWPSHLTVCAFLILAGIAFLQQTQWIVDSWRWFGNSRQWLSDSWEWVVNLWPF